MERRVPIRNSLGRANRVNDRTNGRKRRAHIAAGTTLNHVTGRNHAIVAAVVSMYGGIGLSDRRASPVPAVALSLNNVMNRHDVGLSGVDAVLGEDRH